MKHSKRFLIVYLGLTLGLTALNASAQVAYRYPAESDEQSVVRLVALGSCAHQDKPQPLLDTAAALRPDLFLFLGDNIYGDTKNMAELRRKYERWMKKPEYGNLASATRILAVWDDHDYGANDAGRYYPFREESKTIFLDVFAEPEKSSRRDHPGIYHSVIYGPPEKRVQVIMLDTRTFRDNLLPNDGKPGHKYDYRPNPSPDSAFLGERQWAWLDSVLREPAQLRIIMSSTQFAHEYNGYESWTNVPREQERMLETLKRTRASGVVFISGDVHWGELSQMLVPGLYPVYDLTSSGITSTWDKPEPNQYRVGDVVMENNIGLIHIDWEAKPPLLRFQLKDTEGRIRLDHPVPLSDLSLPAKS